MKPEALQAPAARDAARRARHWRRVRALTAVLLLAWAGISFGVVCEARTLDFPFFGWPFSFWWAAQGAPLAFLGLVAIYAWTMNRLDVRYGVDEQD
jgi:putative solute:sodium symporter small subunit